MARLRPKKTVLTESGPLPTNYRTEKDLPPYKGEVFRSPVRSWLASVRMLFFWNKS